MKNIVRYSFNNIDIHSISLENIPYIPSKREVCYFDWEDLSEIDDETYSKLMKINDQIHFEVIEITSTISNSVQSILIILDVKGVEIPDGLKYKLL